MLIWVIKNPYKIKNSNSSLKNNLKAVVGGLAEYLKKGSQIDRMTSTSKDICIVMEIIWCYNSFCCLATYCKLIFGTGFNTESCTHKQLQGRQARWFPQILCSYVAYILRSICTKVLDFSARKLVTVFFVSVILQSLLIF